VFEAEEVEDGGVPVVDVDGVDDAFVAELVGFAVAVAGVPLAGGARVTVGAGPYPAPALPRLMAVMTPPVRVAVAVACTLTGSATVTVGAVKYPEPGTVTATLLRDPPEMLAVAEAPGDAPAMVTRGAEV
jgi:hypothetical protein